MFPSAQNETLDYLALSEVERFELADSSSPNGLVSENECLLKMWQNFSNIDSGSRLFCNATWDYFYCWPPAPAGTMVTRNCSDVISKALINYSIPLKGKVRRICSEDGTWINGKRSNYKECAASFKVFWRKMKEDETVAPLVQYTLFIGSILSIVCLVASLSIFRCYGLLACDRITVQAHLMISLVLRFVFMFIIAEPHIFDHSSTFRDVNILCEFILVGFLYSTFSSVSWMFIQGLYLNITLMAGALNRIVRYHLTIYYIIGWVVPALFTFAFVVAMLLKAQERCWNGYSKMKEMWILLYPIIFEVLMNGIFLLNILRILLRKVRNSQSRSDASQIKAAAKATALLFPVLGVNNLVLLYNPGGDYNKYFVALNTFFGSTQGIFVAIVYCFINKEVLGAIRRSVERLRARRSLNAIPGNDQKTRARNVRHETIELSTVVPQRSSKDNCLAEEI